VPAYNLHSPQISRGDVSPTPIYLRRARAQGIVKEIPLYLPHSPMLESTEDCLVEPGRESLRSPEEISSSEGCQEARALGNTRSIQHPILGKDQYLPNQNLALGAAGNPGDPREESRMGQPGGPELSKERKLGLKKLVLTEEQKNKLLDWSDCTQEHKTGEQLSQESAENIRGGSLKPTCSSTLSQAVKEKLLSQKKALGGMRTPAVKAPQEREVPPPKSPLKLIANAILRSLLHNSEAGKKTSPKPESKTLPRGQPHARSFSLRKLGSSKDGDQQSPGRHMAKKASAFFSLASPTSKVAQASDLSLPNSILRSRSLPSRPSKMFFSTTPHSKVEDVPTLLEKVSLQDATHSPKTGASHISSLGLKDKSFESFLQECKQRKDIGDFFNSPKEEGPPGNRVPSLEKLVQPVGSTSMGQVAHPSSTGQDARK
jgi:hypothetical protein